MKVRCPKCKKEALYEGNPYRPFCSERCKLIDLGDWADGKYAIPVENSQIPDKDKANEDLDSE